MASSETTEPELGTSDGLSHALFRPSGEPSGGVVVLHGAGSRKENHFDFARRCAAAGLAALAFDQRGHGASGGALDGRALEDVVAMAGLLGDVPVALRGSSMGGWLALAAARPAGAAAVVAVCPARGDLLRSRLDEGAFAFEAEPASLGALIARVDVRAEAAALGERLLLLHAEDDETVPVAESRTLHDAAPGSRLLVSPGGDHRSVQHDPDSQAQSVEFILERCRVA